MRNPALKKQFGAIWDEVARCVLRIREVLQTLLFARAIARPRLPSVRDSPRSSCVYAEERTKPSEKRLREFADSNLPSQEQSLYSPAPIYPAMEQVVLAEYFRFLKAELGEDDPVVKAVLDGRSPAAAAKRYLSSTKLTDQAERKRLARLGGRREEVQRRDDQTGSHTGPARPGSFGRVTRTRCRQCLPASDGKIAQARFAVHGAGDYPRRDLHPPALLRSRQRLSGRER